MMNSLNEFDICPSAYSKCITNVNKSIVICCFGNTEISNSLGGELNSQHILSASSQMSTNPL